MSGHADPAVLLKAYSAEVIRGHYTLGKRVVRVGETVRVQSVNGALAMVKTLDDDPLTVYLADLRAIPEKPLPASSVAPSPTGTPIPEAVKTSESAFSVLGLLAATPAETTVTPKESAAVKAKATGGPRREVSVQCSGTTKKGTPCTRMTKSPNGLCWQHGGD